MSLDTKKNHTLSLTLTTKWTVEKAHGWHQQQRHYHQGVNFIPSTAVNQIQFWYEFDQQEERIVQELTWAVEKLGFTAVRVFLHDVNFYNFGRTFLRQVDRFLNITSELGLKTVLVMFEGIWNPIPKFLDIDKAILTQPDPVPFVHNSQWVQSPGREGLKNWDADDYMKEYVQTIVRRFAWDDRVLMIDLFDQPDNTNDYSYGYQGTRIPTLRDRQGTELPALEKVQLVFDMIPSIFEWAREAAPNRTVPFTVAAWQTVNPEENSSQISIEQLQIQSQLRTMYLNESDVLSFQHWGEPKDLLRVLDSIKRDYPGRPTVLTGFMARDDHSTFDPVVGDMYTRGIWTFSWGLVNGKTNTIFNSDSWYKEYDSMPELWHHDVLWTNGSVYDRKEQCYLKNYQSGNTSKCYRIIDGTNLTIWDLATTGKEQPYRSLIVVIIGVLLLLSLWVYKSAAKRQRMRHFNPVHLEDDGAFEIDDAGLEMIDWAD